MTIEKTTKLVGLFALVAPIVWGAFTFVINEKHQREARAFKNYHNLIAEAYDGGRREQAGSQRALIFELANFPEYKEFTCRELPRMKKTFTNQETLKEIGYTFSRIGCQGEI